MSGIHLQHLLCSDPRFIEIAQVEIERENLFSQIKGMRIEFYRILKLPYRVQVPALGHIEPRHHVVEKRGSFVRSPDDGISAERHSRQQNSQDHNFINRFHGSPFYSSGCMRIPEGILGKK